MDYYVDAATPGANGGRRWTVTSSSQSERLGLLADLRRALDLAILYARGDADRGVGAQVHCRLAADQPWFTAWCAPGATPRHRERGALARAGLDAEALGGARVVC